MKKRLLALASAAAIAFSITTNAFALGTAFKDIDNVSSKEKIMELQNKGVVYGTAEGVFSPGSKVTAAQSIQLLVRAFDLNLDTIRFIKAPKATDYFSKANDNAWYAEALIIGSVRGLEFPGDMDPEHVMTREEYTYYLIKAAENYGQLPNIKLVPSEIADDDQITAEYSGAIQRALKYGVASLDKEDKFNPNDELSRAEAAEMLYNALEYLKAHPSQDSGLETDN